MPISEKIIEQVSSSDISENEKSLILALLKVEDDGIFRFNSEYEKLINSYLENQEGEVRIWAYLLTKSSSRIIVNMEQGQFILVHQESITCQF